MPILPELERELLVAYDRRFPLAGTSRRRHRVRFGTVVLAACALAAIAIGSLAVALFRHRAPGAASATSGTRAGAPAAADVSQLRRGHWSELPPAPIGSRGGVSQVWSGHELLVWGGASGSQGSDLRADGAAYDPASDSWTPIPRAPISGRSGQAAVWDGRELIVWGGYDRIGRRDRAAAGGAAYDPSSGSWRRLPPAPLSARAGAFAVWTGQEVIVLGGAPAVPTSTVRGYGDGAAYDPATDTWTHISAPAAPAGHRLDWVAVAQGNGQLYAWSNWSTERHSGNRYTYDSGVDLFEFDERTGRWRLMPRRSDEVAAPDTALWTGRQVIVRGSSIACQQCSPPFEPDISAELDPATGTWTRLAPDPLGSNAQLSAWTGAALFSWNDGGIFGKTVPGDATAYDPATRAWSRLPRAPRVCGAQQAPVWTGQQLLTYCPEFGKHDALRSGGLAFTAAAPASAPAPARSRPGTLPAPVPGAFLSLVPACACGRHTELELFSDASGGLIRRLLPVSIPTGEQLQTPAATDAGRLLLTYSSGERCAVKGYMECPRFAADSCRNAVLGLAPGQRAPAPLFAVPGSQSVGSAVPSPDGTQVALTSTPCVSLHGTTGLFTRDLATGTTRAVLTTSNRCDGFGRPAWNAAGTELAVPFDRADGAPTDRGLAGIVCPGAGRDRLAVVSLGSGGARYGAVRLLDPSRGCLIRSAAFDGAGIAAIEGCNRGSPPDQGGAHLGDAYLLQFDAAGRTVERLRLERGLEDGLVASVPGTGSVLVTQNQPANSGYPERDWVWEFAGRHLRAIGHYRADDADQIQAVPW
jgi:hypothetical protein